MIYRLLAWNVPITYFGATALHIWTVYIAATSGGLLQTILTFFFPVVSEIYWLITISRDRGFYNPYTIACLIWALSFILTMITFSIMEKRKKQF